MLHLRSPACYRSVSPILHHYIRQFVNLNRKQRLDFILSLQNIITGTSGDMLHLRSPACYRSVSPILHHYIRQFVNLNRKQRLDFILSLQNIITGTSGGMLHLLSPCFLHKRVIPLPPIHPSICKSK